MNYLNFAQILLVWPPITC